MLVAGLDIGRRSDYSALTLLDTATRQIIACIRLAQVPYADQIKSIEPLLAKAGAVAVDRSGVGDGVIEMIPPSVRAIPVVIVAGANVTVRPDAVVAGKSALIKLLVSSRVSVSPDAPGRDELRAEMANFVVTGIGRHGLKMEARAGGKDDRVLSAALAVLAASLAGRS